MDVDSPIHLIDCASNGLYETVLNKSKLLTIHQQQLRKIDNTNRFNINFMC